MNRSQRDSALETFRTDPKISLMIATLKCGGQSLNLTCANRVISLGMFQLVSWLYIKLISFLDPWWNHPVRYKPSTPLWLTYLRICIQVEQQALGRVFRISQEKETYFTRFIIKNSVDGRILGLQSGIFHTKQ
jgi:hypothetical protein